MTAYDPIAHKKWRDANPDKWKPRNKAWRANNIEKAREIERASQAKRKDKKRVYERARYQANSGKLRASSKAYYLKNKERIAEYLKQYAEKHRIERARNEHNRRARKKGAGGTYTMTDVDQMYRSQNCECLCGRPLGLDYHVDHKTPISRGGSNWPHNLQLLCPSCNLTKARKTMDEWAPVVINKKDF